MPSTPINALSVVLLIVTVVAQPIPVMAGPTVPADTTTSTPASALATEQLDSTAIDPEPDAGHDADADPAESDADADGVDEDAADASADDEARDAGVDGRLQLDAIRVSILEHLRDREDPVELSALAAMIAGDGRGDAASSAAGRIPVERVEVRLHHADLPVLDAARLLAYDPVDRLVFPR